MHAYSITEAKARLSALLLLVARGESVILTKRGKPVAQIVPWVEPVQKPKFDLERLRAFRATMPKSKMSSAVMIRKMRDEEGGW